MPTLTPPAPPPTTPATLDDLMAYDGNAELIDGRIVPLMPTGTRPNRVGFNIAVAFDRHAKQVGHGMAYTDGAGFAVGPLRSRRQSFSPDAAYATPAVENEDFYPGAPLVAAEVRSKNDYGPQAERDVADKRADYFEAGTLVVWDVDPDAETVAVYRHTDPTRPAMFGRGAVIDGGLELPGFKLAVDDLFA